MPFQRAKANLRLETREFQEREKHNIFTPNGRNHHLYTEVEYYLPIPLISGSEVKDQFLESGAPRFFLCGNTDSQQRTALCQTYHRIKKTIVSFKIKINCLTSSKAPARKPSVSRNIQKSYHAMAFEEGGFGSNTLRRIIWPKVFGLRNLQEEEEIKRMQSSCSDSLYHPDAVIRWDLDRSLWNIETQGKKMTPRRMTQKRQSLSTVIHGVMSAHQGNLHYYQGYHDVISVILLILGEEAVAFAVAEQCSLTFLKKACEQDLTAVGKLLNLVHSLLHRFDPELARFLTNCGVRPYYALSWVLTWFAHDITELEVIARIFDVLFVSDPIFSVYLSAAVVIISKDSLFTVEHKNDPAVIHHFLQEQPKKIDFESAIHVAKWMSQKVPPRSLQRRASLKNMLHIRRKSF